MTDKACAQAHATNRSIGEHCHEVNPQRGNNRSLRRFAATLATFGTALTIGLAAANNAAAADPITINVVDVAGNLALTQEALEARTKNPQLVSKITYTKAPAPELAGKVKAMQAAGRADIDLVLTGTDAMAAGIAQNLWTQMLRAAGADPTGFGVGIRHVF